MKTMKMTTLFGDRMLYVVTYPSDMTAQRMTELMEWAKAWDVLSLSYESTVIACRVKEHYAEHFEKDNEEYITKYKPIRNEWIEVDETIYDYVTNQEDLDKESE